MHVVFFLLKKSPEARFCLALGSVRSLDVDVDCEDAADDDNCDNDGDDDKDDDDDTDNDDDNLGSAQILESSGHTRGWGTPSHLEHGSD